MKFSDTLLGLDGDLLEAAAELSSELPEKRISRFRLEAWINAMPEKEKNTLLLELAGNGTAHAQTALLRRFVKDRNQAKQRSGLQNPPRRPIGQLLASAQLRATERKRREAEHQAAEQLRREQQEASARTKFLNKLAGREAQIWEQADTLIQTKQPNNYDLAVTHLVDLRDLAFRQGQMPEFDSALARLRTCHQQKSSFLRRLANSGL